MTVKLSIKVGNREHASVSVGRTEFDAKVRETRIGVTAHNGVRMSASIGANPVLDISSCAVQVIPSGEAFQGPYVLTPTLPGFDIGTRGLYMTRDVIVKPIPISEVTNKSNGYTVTIG